MKAMVIYFMMLMLMIATIKLSDFNKILTDEFKNKKPSEALVVSMFESNYLHRHYYYSRV